MGRGWLKHEGDGSISLIPTHALCSLPRPALQIHGPINGDFVLINVTTFLYLQGVAEQESRRGADAAEKLYFESFDAEGVSAEEGALEAEHEVRRRRREGFLHGGGQPRYHGMNDRPFLDGGQR